MTAIPWGKTGKRSERAWLRQHWRGGVVTPGCTNRGVTPPLASVDATTLALFFATPAFLSLLPLSPSRVTLRIICFVSQSPKSIADNGFGERVNWNSVLGWMTKNMLARQTAEAVWAAAGRRHLARLGRLAPARCQKRILLGLVHEAAATRFGRDHDFRRIRTLVDYRRLVPLYSRADLWREYWQPVYPHLAGATWPGPSVALQAAHRSALQTALALVKHLRPRARLLSGALLVLSDEGPSSRTEHTFLAECLPALVRPYTVPCVEIEAERFAHLPVTGLIGPAERLLLLLDKIKQAGGKRCLRDIWPQLSAILYTRRPTDRPAARLRTEAGETVLLLEMVGRAEGPIAIEDPCHGLFRLLFDHGVYFEFVPPAQADEPRCPRFGIEEIELGVPYELALTSPAGLWACRLGRTVCLERRQPPLLRFVETAICKPSAAEARRPRRRTDLMSPTELLPEAHPQNTDIPAALPENAFHSPWSILADRG